MKGRPGAADAVAATQSAVMPFAEKLEGENVIEDDDVTFQTTNFRYLDQPAAAVPLAFDLNYKSLSKINCWFDKAFAPSA